MNPTVSVIIPNYNYARFLKQRIESVLNQTYQDFEIILLDDKSTDNSVEIIEQYKLNPKISKIIINDICSGSPFKQWYKGIMEARGKYIWIAESDDYADKTFLKILVQKLADNDNVGLVYCRSWRIDENNNIIELLEPWANEENKDRWNNDFINKGIDEIMAYPVIGTNIHNISAVVFRKALVEKVDKRFMTFRYGGDWFFFISAMLHTDIGFCAQNMNYYRWHSASVTTYSEKTGQGLVEWFRILNYLKSKVKIDSEKYKKISNQWTLKWSLTITEFSLKLNLLIFWQAFKLNKLIVLKVVYFILSKLKQYIKDVFRNILPNSVVNFSMFMKLKLKTNPVEIHIQKGNIPWSPTYNEYQRYFVNKSITNSSLLQRFKNNKLLPANYGVGVDERCVEYPWLFVNLPEDAKYILDAGSVLNYEYILNQSLFKNRNLTIMTLAPEGTCFCSKGISYIFADLRNIPIKDEYFDVVVCISTLEHIGLNNIIFTNNSKDNEDNFMDFIIVMKELRRILKPHGSLFLSVPYGVYAHLGMQQQFDRKLLSSAMDAFGKVDKVIETFYRYSANGWQQATDKECAGCQYVEWISRVWEKGVPIPKSVPIEPDLAAAARAVACVLLVKD